MGLCDPSSKMYLHNYKPTYLNHQKQLNELGKIDLDKINQLRTNSEITQPAPLPQSSTNLQRKNIRTYSLDTTNRQFLISPEETLQYQQIMMQ